MTAFHVYVEGPVDRTPEGIELLAVAISKKYGLGIPDLIKRMTAGRFRVKANIDAATADAYARALEEVGARVKVEEATPTMPTGTPVVAPIIQTKSGPVLAAAAPAEAPRKKEPTIPGEKGRAGRYSVSPPLSSARTPVPAPTPAQGVPPPRSKAPSNAPAPSSGPPREPPREAHPKSQLMPPSRVPPPTTPPPLPGSEHLNTTSPPPRDRIGSASVAPVPRSAASTHPPVSGGYSSARPEPVAETKERSGGTSVPPPSTSRSTLPPPNAPRSNASSLPPANAPRSNSSSLPPQNATSAKNAPFQSGLSAAYSQELPQAADLGSLGDLSLSSLDGDDASAGPEGSFGPPPSPGMPASIGPPPGPAATFTSRPSTTPAAPTPPKPFGSRDVPLDMFAPPDAEEAQQEVALAVDDVRPKKTTLPPTRTQTPASPPLGASSMPSMRKAPKSQGAAMGGVSAPETPRSRIIAGVVLSIILGFIPAHFIAASRESTAFAKIDAQIVATQAAADTPEMYEALDAFRATQLEKKQSERRSIALVSMLIWAVVGAGLGYVWFRRIPWDRMPNA